MSRSNPIAAGNLLRPSLPDPASGGSQDGGRETTRARSHEDELADDGGSSCADGDAGVGTGAERQPGDDRLHEETSRQRLRLRLSGSAQETMTSFAGARGISRAALIDALLHGLDVADQSWLEGVIEQARQFDVHYRNEDG